MKMQSDTKHRVVALTNLRAMCERISGTAHTFYVQQVTANRVIVGYSNPNEYGTPYPVFAHYPSYPSGKGAEAKENPFVVLDAINYSGMSEDSEDWQAFMQLTDCPQLWRNGGDGVDWLTGYESRLSRHPEFKITNSWSKGGSIQTYHSQGKDFPSFREASEWAEKQMKEIDYLNRG